MCCSASTIPITIGSTRRVSHTALHWPATASRWRAAPSTAASRSQDNDSTTVTIPVTFSYAGANAAGRSILNTGAVDYHVLGDVTVGSPVGSFTVPYSSTGRFTTTGIGR